ncbi:MAG: hypothetical protein M3Y27_05225, partial [Acidobacteriota bacterium]|nr:hypothetical protein [Acidobacteriota bacterium]
MCLNTLSVVLEPGESIELEIWSAPDPEQIVKGHHSVAQALKLLKKAHRSRGSFDPQLLMVAQPAKRRFNSLVNALHSGVDKIQYKLIDEIVTQSAMAQLTTKRVVRLVHAVDRPKAPRLLQSVEHRSGHLQFHPVVLTVDQADPTKADNTWNLFVAKQESARRDCLLWPSEEGGSTTFFVGKVGVDRLTSGGLRCDARWLEYVPDSVRYDSKQRVWVHDPPLHYAQLFTIDTIGLTDDLRDTPLDLLRTDELTRFRALTHSFVNGKARRLSLRLIATSRFTDYYSLETKREIEARKATGIGRYERGTKDFPTHRVKLASAIDNNDVWVPCTFRPTAPEIDRILPVFHWTNDSHDGGQ